MSRGLCDPENTVAGIRLSAKAVLGMVHGSWFLSSIR